MKLLRLTSNNEDGTFENGFNEDIRIKPGAEIALQNLSLELKTENLTINTNNNALSFQTAVSEIRNTFLWNETITPMEYDDFFLDHFDDTVNKKLKCENDNNDFNTQYKTVINKDNKIEMTFFKSVLFDYVPTLSENSEEILVDETDEDEIVISQYGSRTTDQTNKVVFLDKFINGAGVFRCKIANFTDNSTGLEDNGFEIGLSKIAPSKYFNNEDMTNYQRTYTIRFNRIGENYKFMVRRSNTDTAAEDDSGVAAVNGVIATDPENDILELMLSEGVIIGNVYISNVKHELFRDESYSDVTSGSTTFFNLYPYIIMYGEDDDVRISGIQHSFRESSMQHYDQINFPDKDLPKLITSQTVLPQPKNLIGYNEEGKFLFAADDIQKWFGFNKIENKAYSDGYLSNNRFEHLVFKADNVFKPVSFSKSIIVEMMNLPLLSYDSLKKGRMSILSVVPDDTSKTDNITDIITYEPNQLNFISIDNINPLLLRNIRCRLLNKNLEPIKTRGLSVLTILVRE